MEEMKEEFTQQSNGEAEKKIPRRAWVASVLSFLAPGVGQAFNGDLKGAVLWGITIPTLGFIASPARLIATFGGLVIYFMVQVLIMASSARSAFRYASKHARENGSRPTSWLRSFGAAALAGVLVGILGYAVVASLTIRFYKITTNSMAPTISAGDRIAVDLGYYNHHTPQIGDVVAVMRPNGLLIVKRIAALGGEVAEGKEGRIFVNAKPFDDRRRVEAREVQQMPPSLKRVMEFGPETVPPGEFFVLGDNRAHSWDSRSPDFGPVDRSDIKGRVLYAYWSNDLSHIGQRIE